VVEEKMAAGATPATHEAASELRQGLKALQHRLNLFIEYAPAAFAMFDRDLRYIFASRRWKENIGLADQDLVGQRHYDIFPDLPAEWIDAHARCLAGESLGASEDTFEHNGKTEWLRWQIEPWRDDSGDVGGIIMFGEFITARKELEAELAMHQKLLEQRVAERTRELAVATADAHLANEQKSAFLSATSHDLRQPLQAASTYLSVIESRAEPEISAVAKKALGALQVASDILSALLNLSQLNAGAVAVQPERFRVHALQERLILQFQSDAASKNIELVCRPSDLILRTDPRLLERIVANFVANSIRFTSSGFVELGCVRHE
jgi:PAS domain S-box-containing protein